MKYEQIERFWAKVDRRGSQDCWPWTGSKDFHGYGHFSAMGRLTKASRVSYHLAYGPIPDGLVVMHICDNPECVNPSHLKAGTQKENVRDCINKNRRANLKGEEHGRARITEETVWAIRDAVASGIPQIEMARAFGISKNMVWKIISRITWRHV